MKSVVARQEILLAILFVLIAVPSPSLRLFIKQVQSFMDFTIIIPSRMYLQLSQIDW